MLRLLLIFVVLSILLDSSSGQVPATASSGLKKGDEVSAWEPVHLAGPHVGTKACPVCTYLDAPMLLVFAKDLPEAELFAKPLERIASAHASGKLKVTLVVVDAPDEKLVKLAAEQNLRFVMLCRPDLERRTKQLATYKINPAVNNTILLYDNYIVRESWVGLSAANLPDLVKATDAYLPRR